MNLMKRFLCLSVFLLCLAAPATAQSASLLAEPLHGAYDYYRLLSPSVLGRTISPAWTQPPIAAAINPALNATIQRVYLEAGYGTMFRSEDPGGLEGHSAVLATSVPFRWGVISGSLHVMNSTLPGYMLNTSGSLHASFSKAITEQFWFGFGIRSSLGGDPLDWGLGLDLGGVYTFYPQGIPYVRLGFALQNLGKWYAPVSGYSAMPAPFSLALGVDAKLVERDNFEFSLIGGLEFPTFLDILMDAGFSMRIAKVFEVYSSVQIDFLAYVQENRVPTALYPSFGIAFNIPLDRVSLTKDSESVLDRGGELMINLAASPKVRDVWQVGASATAAFGIVDKFPPEVMVGLEEEEAYVSPNNDGVKDSLRFDLSVDDDRYVERYEVTVYDSDRNVVRRIHNKEKRIENQLLQGFFSRLFAGDEGVDIPSEIIWDGKMDDGMDAPDGDYHFTVYAEDDTGNAVTTDPISFEIDREAPELSISQPDASERIFSPNGDGRLDTISFSQESSVESFWRTEIVASDGSVVRSFDRRETALSDFVWDGTDNDGVLIADGVYEYSVRGRDRAGNETLGRVSNIVLKTESTPLSLYIQSAAFSPDNDGVSDALTLVPLVGVRSGLDEWKIDIYSEGLTLASSFAGTEIPETFLFYGKDERGDPLPEGIYFATMRLQYAHGNAPEVSSPPFMLDISDPEANVGLSDTVISPNGDGIKDVIVFSQRGTEEELWVAEILSAAQESIFRQEFYNTAPPEFSWDGRTSEGRLAADGRYIYKISSRDIAGNYGESKIQTFSIDTSAADVILTAEFRAFSPNADGVQDRVGFFPTLSQNNQSESYRFSVDDSDGLPVYEEEGRGMFPDRFEWDGRTQTGDRAPDGEYVARLTVAFPSGISSDTQTASFTVDTVAPRAQLELKELLFSPDGDGNKDALRITQSSDTEREWRGYILTEDGEVVRKYLWENQRVDFFLWDGKDDRGNVQSDGIYRYSLSSVDAAGNRAEYEVGAIEIDTRPAALYLTLDQDAFSPNGDGRRDELNFSLIFGREEGMEEWTLDVVDAETASIWRYRSREPTSSQELVWDGRSSEGSIREGIFTALFSARYENGASPRVESAPFRVDNSPPLLAVDIEPEYFSPDDDGVDDVLTFFIRSEDLSEIERWELEIRDRTDELFQSFSGTGDPSPQLRWDGRSFDGELVISAEDYPYTLTAVDELGNEATLEGAVPVDVLVIRDGDRLKVRISAITFEPNSAELILNPEDERGIKNLSVLQRLVEIFKKYRNYHIRIEGHAVNITGTEREDREELIPLSEARAAAVKRELNSRGISAGRIETVGRGGKEPIVSHTDLVRRWRNRRVEFILLK